MTGSNQKTAIVTGAGRGIGAAIARELAGQGITVVVNYAANHDSAGQTVRVIEKAGGNAFAVQANVQNADELDRLFATVESKCGRLDILVNNAGIGGAAPLEQINSEMIDNIFAVNITAMLLGAQRAVKAFGAKGGSIVNVSSSLASQPMATQAVYAASKAGLEAATRVLAQELGSRKIRVNAVAPGSTETDLLPLNDDLRGFLSSRTALGRVGQPGDIATVVAFLASDAAGWITGQVIGVDGGLRI